VGRVIYLDWDRKLFARVTSSPCEKIFEGNLLKKKLNCEWPGFMKSGWVFPPSRSKHREAKKEDREAKKERSRSKESNIKKQRKKDREAKKATSRSKESNIKKQRKKIKKQRKQIEKQRKKIDMGGPIVHVQKHQVRPWVGREKWGS
jgi:uncharacterized Zn finger protein (UPF0148 family)